MENDNLLRNAEQLKTIFEIDRISNKYIEYVPLKDTNVGFSVKREYPVNIRYTPPKTKDGKLDTVALFFVFYGYGVDLTKTQQIKIPLFLSNTK